MVAPTAEAASFVVVNTNDSGGGSLRQAIIDCNNNGSAVTDTITFNIPGSGVKTITLLSQLPDINTPLVIDGYSQPGSVQNTNVSGAINAVPLIELNGASAGAGAEGMLINVAGNTIRGLIINRFDSAGIRIQSNNNKVEGCFIGTDAAGLADQGNSGGGVSLVSVAATNNTIGGTTAAARNVISGNNTDGINSAIGNSNIIQGNLIGTDKSGTAAIGNTNSGINSGASNWIIGGTTTASRNVIAGNGGHGIDLSGTVNLVRGNYIGTTLTGPPRSLTAAEV
jgi:hypothetical protein